MLPSEQTEGICFKVRQCQFRDFSSQGRQRTPISGYLYGGMGRRKHASTEPPALFQKLRREALEFYLAYTTKIYELAEK